MEAFPAGWVAASTLGEQRQRILVWSYSAHPGIHTRSRLGAFTQSWPVQATSRYHCAVHPPSIGRAAPVSAEVSSRQRKSVNSPICSGEVNLSIGCFSRRSSSFV